MIEASGDSAHPGRSIDDNFESSITYEIAQSLKAALLEQCPHLKVLINRSPHETIAALQNANFANKLNVDFYVSIHAFTEAETKPRIYVYQFSYRDNFISKDADQRLSFYPFDKIYLINTTQTTTWAQQIKQLLERDQRWSTHGPFAIPFKPLIGIKAPAIGIEIGLKNRAEWQNAVDLLVHAIVDIVNNR